MHACKIALGLKGLHMLSAQYILDVANIANMNYTMKLCKRPQSVTFYQLAVIIIFDSIIGIQFL